LLSGRNFETKQYEEAISEASFGKLKKGVLAFMNKTHFDRITMILRSAGFVTSDLIGGRNNVNFAYILYLRGRAEGMAADDIEKLVRRWYAMSSLTRRYAGNPETTFDFDIRQIETNGLAGYTSTVFENELAESFWTGMLPQLMDTSSSISPYFLCYKAAQVKLADKGFLSRDISVLDLLLNRADAHHVFPRGTQRSRVCSAVAITRSRTSCSRRARLTSPSATSRPRSISSSLPPSAMVVRRSMAASLPSPTCAPTCARAVCPSRCLTVRSRITTSFWISVVSSWRRRSRPGLKRCESWQAHRARIRPRLSYRSALASTRQPSS
jgi:hypothetical protein